MAHTHTLLWSSFSSVRRVSLHLPMHLPMHLLLSSGRSSYFRMVFCSFHFLPIFLLAQILMRADLGDEPEHPLEVVISNPPGQDATRTPQLPGWSSGFGAYPPVKGPWVRLRTVTLSGSDTRSRCQRFGFPRRFGLSGGISGPRFRC